MTERKKSIFSNITDLVGICERGPAESVRPEAVNLSKGKDCERSECQETRSQGMSPKNLASVHYPTPLMGTVHPQALLLDHFALIHQMMELAATQRVDRLESRHNSVPTRPGFPLLSHPFLWNSSSSGSTQNQTPTFPAIASTPSASGTVLMLANALGKATGNRGDASSPPPQLAKLPPSLGTNHSKQQSDSGSDLSSYQFQLPAHPPNSLTVPPNSIKSTGSGGLAKQAPRFQCPDCNRSYSTFSGLSKHRQFHCTSQLKKQFSCKFCEKQYSSLGALKMHIRTHTLPCKCQMCGKAFSRPWLLQGHLRTHTGEKPFRCGHCGRSFADRSNLRAHLQTHSEVKKYRCKSCQKTFSRMSLLNKHEGNGCPGVLL